MPDDEAIRAARDREWRAALGGGDPDAPDVRELRPSNAASWLALCEESAAAAAGDEALDARNGAYAERNEVVALLAALFPSSLEIDPAEPDSDWHWVVLIDLPAGQVSWHFEADLLPLFDHVPRRTGARWDGHDTVEKYARVRRSIELLRDR